MIHPQAIVEPGAKLAEDVEVGPWSYIGADVEIGAGTCIGPHVVIKGPTVIGEGNRIFQFASVGEECQDKKYNGEPTRLVIGDRNVIREGCTIHRGTIQDEGITRIGSDNLLMAYVHVAHDCVVGDHCILANSTALAGHVKLGDYAILGGFTAVHQFCQIGPHVMCGAGTVVLKDIPAYVMANGNTAEPHGINMEGLRRRGFSPESLRTLRQAYKIIYRKNLTVAEALPQLQQMAATDPAVQPLIDSLSNSTRGIIR
ncbi:Acyl-[acyl-carrier-protein]--UDP-N- acetylglucosamine O-acyltransferase [Marinobacterium lacunae]|uniref:Acyl-[acyl-carrier-protein]--UDP-N-acetylglucosamine O-acyltransferase n=1 Tax=Marinobacterium lacunae TaxID=1232683 RepID=A0A081G0R1_9GAMM|nr:acyl-ACP--UDP-N-acetylglucosamine O-acyltransferase [Marinobacterium lacunae]KEA64366.1 Acyl-[acyl-carrier-protein]--UDP-N- acetylglucosamine O-acyltransferase [Marinobacterium lacunae]MBR9885501.1 acyl-ACP--UDP-N-acetylglucosamine O-acyltransferase [Oceanospirillales bacterium]